jgi:Xaa-Pro aminopeptidase
MRATTAAALLGLLLLAAAPAPAEEVPESVAGGDLRAEHAARRAALAAALPDGGLAVVPAQPADPMGLYAERQDEDFGWLTGLDDPNGLLLLTAPPKPGEPHGELLLLPRREPWRESWVGPRAHPSKEWQESLGVAAVADLREAAEQVAARLKAAKAVLVPRGTRAAEYADRLCGDAVRASGLPVTNLRETTGPLRLVKSAEEVARIRRASVLTAEGHRRAMAAARPGMPEYAVQAVLEEACRAGGCRRQAYDSIVASGPNACILHYGRNRRVLEEGDLVLLDAGGEYLGYATDVTRTWPVAARFTEAQARAYDAVLAAQAAGEAAAKPGATLKDVDEACRAELERRGFNARDRRPKPAEPPPPDGAGPPTPPKPEPPPPPPGPNVLPHGCCHWVGRNVHDPNGRDAALRPGAVFTIEPGAYFPAEGWGIRIEDTYAVREDGTLECLSKDAPKARAEVEAIRAAALAAK